METSYIRAISYFLPEGKLTHEALIQRFGHEKMEKIFQSIGIEERRVANKEECASDLAYAAAKNLFEKNQVDPKSIDLLIFASQTPDYLIPTTACILQERLQLKREVAAFDINLGCSQYVYAVSVAHSMLVARLASRALVLTGDTISRILDPSDHTVVPLFGDAGTATLLERHSTRGFVDFIFGTDGSGYHHLIWPNSGLRAHTKPNDPFSSQNKMLMDGKAIFLFTLQYVPQMIQQLLERNNLTVEQIGCFVFHQASALIIDTIAKKLRISSDQLVYKIKDCGNSGGSTVGVALAEAIVIGKIKPGMKVVLAAFGVGLSWSAALINW